MRYYPLHIALKDFSFLIILFLCGKYIDAEYPISWWSAKEILGASFYFGISIVLVNLIIFTVIHLALTKLQKSFKSFLFGSLLHVFTIVIALINFQASLTSLVIASTISFFISGYVYKILNSGFSFEKSLRKCAGVE